MIANHDSLLTALAATDAAELRRSIRRYDAEPIPREELEELLRLTGLAPSAWNVQPWRFVVVETPELKARLQEAAFGQAQVGSAPAVIVLYSDAQDALAHLDETVHPNYPAERRPAVAASVRDALMKKSPEEREAWAAAQSHIALGYLLLLARSMGYDSSAMAGFDPARVKALLGLPAHVTIPALVAIGRGAEEGFPHHRHPVDRVATFR
jgi:nitroreductase